MSGTSKAIVSMCVLLLAALVVYYGMTPPPIDLSNQSLQLPSHQTSRMDDSVFGGDPVEKGERLGLLVALPEENLSPEVISEVVHEPIVKVTQELPEPELDIIESPTFYIYTCKEGDTLSEIAQRELGSYKKLEDIAAWNNIPPPFIAIRPGRDLKIYPSDFTKVVVPMEETKVLSTESSTHTIMEGDNFSNIAKQVWGDSDLCHLLQKANPTVNPRRMKIGTKITIPSR